MDRSRPRADAASGLAGSVPGVSAAAQPSTLARDEVYVRTQILPRFGALICSPSLRFVWVLCGVGAVIVWRGLA
jgi:hypothetical protein